MAIFLSSTPVLINKRPAQFEVPRGRGAVKAAAL
jgi:hypothetical protein